MNRTILRPLAAAALVALLHPSQGSAQTPAASPDTTNDPHAAQPERPTVATHAGTVARGWVEVETGVERDRFGGTATGFSTPTVVKIGIAPRMQLSLFGGVVKPADQSSGLGDAAVGIKWRLVDDAPIVGDFAILPIVKFPSGSATAGTGTGTTDASIILISSHAFGSVAMDLNVSYTRRSGDGTAAPRNATLWTASFGGPFGNGPLGWVGEMYGYPATSGPAGQSSIVALLGGPTLQVKSWLVFDMGVIVPLTGEQPHALYAGAVYNIGRLWKTP